MQMSVGSSWHGALHGPRCWDKVVEGLRDADVEVATDSPVWSR
jgi:hypothetical protein